MGSTIHCHSLSCVPGDAFFAVKRVVGKGPEQDRF